MPAYTWKSARLSTTLPSKLDSHTEKGSRLTLTTACLVPFTWFVLTTAVYQDHNIDNQTQIEILSHIQISINY